MTKLLGINIDRKSDSTRINQQDNIEDLCDDMGITYCRVASTPISDDTIIDCYALDLCSKHDTSTYRSAVGTLVYIANMKRPDIE